MKRLWTCGAALLLVLACASPGGSGPGSELQADGPPTDASSRQAVADAFGSPRVVKADLDGDGGEELLSVTLGPDFSPRVQVVEPSLRAGDDREVALDLALPPLAPGQGGTVKLEVLKSPHDPWSLVRVSLCDQGQCVEGLVSYLRARGPLGKLAQLATEGKELAFVPGGLQLAGGPLWRPVEGAFTPEACPECRGMVTLWPETPTPLFTLEIESSERGPATSVPCMRVGTLGEGRYPGRALASCMFLGGAKGRPSEAMPYRFVQQGERQWTLLTRISAEPRSDHGVQKLLRERGITLGTDTETTVNGLVRVESLLSGPWGQVALDFHSFEDFSADGLEVVTTHPALGPIYSTRLDQLGSELLAAGAFYVPQPEGQFLVYSYQLAPALTSRGGHDYAEYTLSCGGARERYANLVEAANADLVLLDKEQRLYKPHPDSSLDSLVWKDPFDRYIQLVRRDLLLPSPCE